MDLHFKLLKSMDTALKMEPLLSGAIKTLHYCAR